jgi:flavin reductase (DIM6/NTAB) family NADH-FMN oxidoreductase RutF
MHHSSPSTPPSAADEQLKAQRALRHALGHFATGVTVITARPPGQDSLVGLTVNSFSSVSMAPALVLWSLSNTSPNLAAFEPGAQHVIHILADSQKDLAYGFASPKVDKFADVNYVLNEAFDAPVIAGCVARFYCETDRLFQGGDHSIILARVLQFDTAAHAPLLFVKGSMLGTDTFTPV